MDANLDWCSFCDAIFRSGVWVSAMETEAAYSCPECGAGWSPIENAPARLMG